MMLPQFKRWVAELSLFYSYPGWPTEENVAHAFADVKHMDGQALGRIGQYIRTEYENWPRSLSAAMRKGYREWEREQAEERKAEAAKREERDRAQWSPPTPEEAERNQQRCRDILSALRSGIQPPWATELRSR